ncbi:MAG: hypothetical protein WBB85_08475 [Albidovulum sp.]
MEQFDQELASREAERLGSYQPKGWRAELALSAVFGVLVLVWFVLG